MPRREKYVRVSFDFLRRVLTGEAHPLLWRGEIRSDCPADLRVLWVDTSPAIPPYARIYVTSATFPELSILDETPELKVEYTAEPVPRP